MLTLLSNFRASTPRGASPSASTRAYFEQRHRGCDRCAIPSSGKLGALECPENASAEGNNGATHSAISRRGGGGLPVFYPRRTKDIREERISRRVWLTQQVSYRANDLWRLVTSDVVGKLTLAGRRREQLLRFRDDPQHSYAREIRENAQPVA